MRQGVAKLAPVIALDTPGDASRLWVVGHQDHVSTGQADVGGERGAFGATFLFIDLHNDFGALFEDILDSRLAVTLGSRTSIVLVGYLLEREEAMAICAKVHEGRFKAGLYPGDLCLINIGLGGATVAVLNIQIVQALPVNQRNPDFLGLGGIDKHFFHNKRPVWNPLNGREPLYFRGGHGGLRYLRNTNVGRRWAGSRLVCPGCNHLGWTRISRRVPGDSRFI